MSASLAVLGALATLACSPPCADDEQPHAAGELVWELLLEGRDDDAVADLAVDACAGVVATGRLWTNAWVDGGNHSDLWLARVNFDGEPVWQLERDHRFDDLGTGVAIAPEGGLISIGNSDSGPYPGSSTVAGWLAYHELDGRERWRVREEVQDAIIELADVTVGADAIYVAGGMRGYDSSAFVYAYDHEGQRVWSHVDSERGQFRQLLLLGDDELLITSATLAPERRLCWQHLSREGEPRGQPVVLDMSAEGTELTLTPDGVVLFARFTGAHAPAVLMSMSLAGEANWTVEIDADTVPLTLALASPQDAIFVAGYRAPEFVSQPWLGTYELDGRLRWSVTLDRIGIAQALAVGPSGDAYLAGVLDAHRPSRARTTSTSGSHEWVGADSTARCGVEM